MAAAAATAIALALGAPVAAQPAGFPSPAQAPKGAPNVLLIMTDDVGFAASSTFGGGIPTPTFDRLAAQGVRFNDFNTKAICSPSRAALLTGRNPHAIGYGEVSEGAVGEPGYSSVMPKDVAPLPRVLKANGYVSAAFGKHHNVPTWQNGPAGPFDQWSRGLGFDYFYGFHGAWTDQFGPSLIENEKAVDPPRQPGYILDRDLADHAIAWLRMQRVQAKDRPFLLYYAPGTAHAPLQAPAEELARFRGRFDAGWDAYRQATLKRQKRLGIVPADTKLAPLPPGVPAWSSLSAEQKRLYARYMEAYAAALAYCDAQIGRIVEELRSSGQLENTLVIYIQGDNGASSEGGAAGSVTYGARAPAEADVRRALAHIDEIGGPASSAIIPVGWAAALDTPFPYYKGVASRLGGVRTGMVVSWPGRVKPGGVRRQMVDISDIAPTLYEAIGVSAPAPLDGVSFAPALADPKAPSRRHAVYSEVLGNVAVREDGWMAATRMREGQEAGGAEVDLAAPWLLFDLTHDFSQSQDVAAAHPETVARLRAMFDAAAKRDHVYPLQTDGFGALLADRRPHPANAPGRYVFHPDGWRYGDGVFPNVLNRSWSMEADLVAPAGGGRGALVAQGGRFSGWGLLMLGGTPTFIYRTNLDQQVRLQAPSALAAGPHRIGVGFQVDGPGVGKGGSFTLSVDGQAVGTAKIARTLAYKGPAEQVGIGEDPGTPLADGYETPFRYDGDLKSVAIELKESQLPQRGR